MMLTLSPLVAAISAGNCAVIKPSEVSPATGEVIARYLPEYLDRKAFSVVLGAVPETTALLEQPWDHIFFTGGTMVAKIVMTAAAKHLTPVVLELGGKNPTIVHSSANLKVAARRIAFGRWVNCGQSCTAPDYVLVFKDVAAEFLKHLKENAGRVLWRRIRKTVLISAGSSALIISIGWLSFSAVERFFTAVSMIGTIASSRRPY